MAELNKKRNKRCQEAQDLIIDPSLIGVEIGDKLFLSVPQFHHLWN